MSILKAVLVVTTLGFTLAGSSGARAVTCEDVRSLTAAEREYWSIRLNLTSEQRHQIWLACYGSSRRHDKNGMLPMQ